MAVSCGFYNSVNHDRVYDAVQFGEMFDGLITDGVYETVGNRMMVTIVSGMTIRVRSGRAWFNKTWTVNTSDYPLDIPAADVLLPRIDAVVLEVDTRLETRNNSLKIISGRSASNPVKPTLTRANGLYQYPLAWVTVPANARSLTASNIEIQVGRDPTPFVTGVVNQTSITDLWNKWDKDFQDWFDEVRDTLGNTGGNLTAITSRVSSLESKVTDLQSAVSNIPKKSDGDQLYKKMTGNDRPSNDVYLTPYIFKFWWGDATDGRNGKAQASKNEILAGTLGDIYISPMMLKQAFPQLYDGSLTGGSGSNISIETGECSYNGTSSVNVLNGKINYAKIGDVVFMKVDVEFRLTNTASNTFFTISVSNPPKRLTTSTSTTIMVYDNSEKIVGFMNCSGSSAYNGEIDIYMIPYATKSNEATPGFTANTTYFLNGAFFYW